MATALAAVRGTVRRTRRADTAGLEIALLERALADGGLFFSRTDPGRQCYYRLSLQPTLFGGLDLVREWGRVGHDPLPRRLVEHYASLAELLPPLSEAVRVRLRHGYRARPLAGRFIPSATTVYWTAGVRAG